MSSHTSDFGTADAERVREKEAAAVNSGDIEGFMAIFTDDAVIMPPNLAPICGKDNIRRFNRQFFEELTTQITIKSEEVVVCGEWAFDRGTFEVTFTPKSGGEPVQDSGKYIYILKQQPDGTWKMARDIWNSNNPSPATN